MNIRLLAGACALSFVLGSLHAYSVLLAPLESWLGSSRAGVSFAYESTAQDCAMESIRHSSPWEP